MVEWVGRTSPPGVFRRKPTTKPRKVAKADKMDQLIRDNGRIEAEFAHPDRFFACKLAPEAGASLSEQI